MKKLLMAVTMMLGFAAVTSAQTPLKKNETKPVSAKPATAPAKVVTMDKSKPTTAKTATVTGTAKVKADGTPDMRYKENKTTAKPAEGPKKADGTPDKRFKENKAPKS